MYITTDSTMMGTLVTPATGEYTLTAGDMYYVHCVIKEATPAPTITATLPSSTMLTSAGSSTTAFPDMNAAQASALADITTTEYFTIVASYASHCDQVLMCSGTNTANTWTGDSDHTLTGPTIKVSGGERKICCVLFNGPLYMCGPIKLMQMSDPTCSLFGDVGITYGMLESGMLLQFCTFQYMVYQFTRLFYSLTFKWIKLHHSSLLRGQK